MAQKINKYSGRKLKKPDMKQEGNFTQIPNAFILNPEIRDPELRLLQYIMMHTENRKITTKNCIMYLGKTMPAISASFEKLVALGILKITDDIIEVIIPVEMKKYKLGYLEGKENNTIEVKKTLLSESDKTLQDGKENFTIDIKKTLLSGKENFTIDVKKTFKKPLDVIDNDNVANPIILSNTRVLPVPATSGSTGQPHSNYNTNGKTGVELGLECVSLQSLASPSVLAPSLHTPKGEDEKVGKELSLPKVDDYSDILPIEVKTLPIVEELPQPTVEVKPLPIEPDKRFAEQLNIYITSKYFLPEKLTDIKNLYNNYAVKYPNKYMPIMDFEEVLIYLMAVRLGGLVKMRGINRCLLYHNDICHYFKDIPEFRQEMLDNPNETKQLLKESELNK